MHSNGDPTVPSDADPTVHSDADNTVPRDADPTLHNDPNPNVPSDADPIYRLVQYELLSHYDAKYL